MGRAPDVASGWRVSGATVLEPALPRITRHHLSFSRRWLAKSCLWWARPEVVLDPRTSSEPAAVGTATHACVEKPGLSPEEAAAAEGLTGVAVERVVDLVTAWRREWPEMRGSVNGWANEVAVAFDAATGEARILPSPGGHRDYSSATPTEVTGTLDLVGTCFDGSMVNADLKTGRKLATVEDHLPQLEAGAVALARVYALDTVNVAIAHLSPDGIAWDERTLDAFDLAMAADAMADEVRRIPTSVPKPGTHCDWCPAKLSCPETLARVEEVLPVEHTGGRVRLPITGAPASDEEAAALYTAVRVLQAWAEGRWAVLRQYVDTRPLPLPDGTMWGKIERNGKETFDLSSLAFEVLGKHLGDAYEGVVSHDTSKAAIERAIRKLTDGKRGELGKRKQALYTELRAIGAMKSGKPYVVYDTILGTTESKKEQEVEE